LIEDIFFDFTKTKMTYTPNNSIKIVKIATGPNVFLRVFILYAVMQLSLFAGKSQTTWEGGTSTVWSLAANWSTGIVPIATTDVVINSGTVRMPAVAASTTIKSLTVNSGASVTINSAFILTVESLVGAGTVTAGGTGTLSVGNASNVSSTFDGILSGTLSLIKTSTATLTLTGTNTYTGATTVSAGTLQLGNNAALGSTVVTTIAANATVDLNGFTTAELFTISGSLVNNSASEATASGAITLTTAAIIGGTGDATVSGIISSTGALTKSGAGTWTLTGTNTYTGSTTISAGTIKMGSATATLGPIANSAVTVTGTLDLNGNSLELGSIAGAGTIKNSVAGTVYLTSGGNNTSTTFSGVIGIIGDEIWVVKKGTGTLILSGANAYSGGTQLMAGTLSVGTIANGGVSSNLGAGDTNPGRLIFSGGTLAVTGATVTTDRGFQINDGSSTINISGTSTTFSGVITSSISTAATLIKSGAGTLVLSGSSTHDAAMTVSAGTFKLGSDQGLGSTVGATTIASGAAVDLNGFSTAEQFAISGSLVNNSASASTASGAITLTTAAAAIFGGTGDATVSGIISGSGTLTKSGAGTWTLSGVNTYSGATTASVGTLKLGNNAALGTTTGTTIALNAFVDLNGYTTTELFIVSGSLVNNSATAATASGAITLTTAAIFGGTGDATVSGVISSTGTLTKSGAGTWTLTGTNTYTNTTAIDAGTIKVGAATTVLGPLANSAITITGALDLNGYNLGVGSIAGAGIITSSVAGSVTLTAGANNTSTIFSGVISDGSGTVSLVKNGTGALTLSGANTYVGSTTASAGTLTIDNSSAFGSTSASTTIASGATVNLNGFATAEPFILSGSLVNNSATAASASGDIMLSTAGIFGGTGAGVATASGVISGIGTLTKNGTSTWLFSGVNTYSAITTVSAGTLRLGNNDGMSTTSAATTIASGASVDLNGFTTAEPFTISGSLVNNSGTAATTSGNITLTTAAIIGGTGIATATGVVSGAGTLQKTGTGTWTLTGANTYSAATTVTAGTLQLGNNAALGTTTLTTIASGAIVDLNGFITAELFTISGSLVNNSATASTISGNITLTTAAIIGGTGTATATGVISGTGTLTKNGTGTWTFSGVNTYSGTSNILVGTLKLGNSAAFGTTAQTIIQLGAFVDLNGFATAEPFTVQGSLLNNGTTAVIASGAIILSSSLGVSTIGGTGDVIATGVISSGTPSKVGTGTWTLSGANTFIGIMYVNAGTIKLGNASALGTTSTSQANLGLTIIASGTTVDLNGFSVAEPITISGSLVNNSSTAAASSGPITLTTAAILGGTGNATASGIISSTGTLKKTGTGTWTLSGVNTFSSITTISEGNLKLGNAAGLGTTTALTGITIIASGASVDLNGVASAEPFTISGSLVNNSVTASTSSGLITLTTSAIFGGTGNATVSGIISSTGSLTKTGTGTFTLSGVNTFTGGVTINAGTLSVGTIGNGDIAGNLGKATNAAANLVLGGGELRYSGGTNSTDRNITLTTGTVSKINISAVAGTTLTVNGATINTTGGFTKEGTGTLTFNCPTNPNLHTGITFVNAGILNCGAGATTIASGQTMYVAVGQTVIIPAGSTLTNNGTVQVDGTLTITGAFVNTGTINGTGTYIFKGTTAQTVPGSLTYPTLTTSNTAGITLGGNVATSGQMTINASNTLQLSGYNLSVNSLTSSGNIANSGSCALLTVNGSTSTTYSGIISGCTGLTKSGTSSLTLTGVNTYTGATTIAGGILSVGTIGNGGASGNMGAASNSASNLVLSGGTLSYTGATAPTDRDFILFAGTSSTISITTTANILTMSGVGSSSGSITKTGTGTLVFSGTNTYTGATTINAGTLSVATFGNGGEAGNLGAATNASSNLVLGGGTLLYTGATASTDRNFTSTNATTSTINIAANTLTWSGASTSTTGAITKSGAGTLVWSGTNLYSGLTTVSAGILQLGNSNALGTTVSTTIALGATVDLNGYSAAELFTISGSLINNSGTATTSGAIVLSTAAIFGGTGTLTATGVISGSGTLTKSGAGSLTLSGINTYTGATTISIGVLKLGSTTALGTTAGATSITSGAVLDLNGITYANPEALTIRGTGISSGGAIMNSSPVSATYPGTITLGSPSSIIGETGSINITSTGAIAGATFGLTIGGTQGGVLTSPLNTTTGTLTKEGTGTWKLSGNSFFTGATTINNGVIKLGLSSTTNSGPLGTSGGTTTINSGATLDFNGFWLSSLSVEQLIPSGDGYNGLGAIINSSSTSVYFQGSINSTNGADFKIGGVGYMNFGGIISGTKNITKIGTNNINFWGANTYTGSTTISNGLLSVETISNAAATSGSLGNNSAIILDGGTLYYWGVTVIVDRTITLNAGKTSYVWISTAASTLTLSGVLSGGGSLVKRGTGTLLLSGVNTYTGSTTIETGTLSCSAINAAGANGNLGAGTDIILNGGTLSYSGLTASTDRNFTLNSGTTSTIIVSTASRILTMSGTVSGAGSIKIANNATGTLEPTGSNTYTGVTNLTSGILKVNVIANGGVNSPIGAASSAASNLVLGTGTFLYTGATGSTDKNFMLGSATTTTFNIDNIASILTIAGSCGSSTGKLTKIGVGTLALTGANKYTGVTTLTAGTLSVASINNGGVAGGMGAATNAVGNIVFNGGHLEYTGSSSSTNRNFTIIAPSWAIFRVTNASTNLTWSGASTNSSTAGIGKVGAGTLTLAGLSNYTGITYINAGTVKLGNQKVNVRSTTASTNVNSGPLGAGGVRNATTPESGTVVAAGATLDYNGYPLGSVGYTYNRTSFPYTYYYTTYIYYENVSISGNGMGGTGAIINSSAKTISTSYTYTHLLADAVIGGTGNYPLIYYTGSSTLTKKGNNTVTFNSVATVTGNIIVDAGILKCAAAANVLGDITGTTTVNSGATLDLNGKGLTIVEPLILNGTGYNNVGALYNSSISTTAAVSPCTITLGSDSKIGGLGPITQSGTISGTGNLEKIGTKTLSLTAATTNTYTGSTTISGGVLSVANFANLGSSGNGASNLVLNGGGLTYSGTTATLARSFTVADGTANIFNTSAAAANIITLTGSSTGGGAMTKAGTATMLVQGGLNHTGGTKDSTGIIELANSAGNALSDNGMFIFGGGTLKTKSGGADETAGTLNMTNSGTLTFGSTTVPHALTFANSVTNKFKDGKLISITNWVKSTRNSDSSFNSGTAGKIFVGNNNIGLTPQQKGKIRFTINTNIASLKYLTFPGVYSSGTTLKKFYSLSAEQLSTGELVPAVPRPIMDIQGTDGVDTICLNQTRTFNYTISNIGDVDALNVNITSDNPNFVIGTKVGSTTVTGITTIIDGTTSTPGSTITFPVVFTSGTVPGLKTLKLLTSSTTARTDNDTLKLQIYVTAPPTFSSSISGGACYSDQFATLSAISTGGSYISWHTSATPTKGDTAFIGNPFIIDPLAATATYYAQANLGSCVTQAGRTLVTATLNAPASEATIASSAASLCSNGSINLNVVVTGGSSPYTLIYNDGTQDIMIPNYVSGTNIPVTVTSSTTFTISSLTDALGCDCEDISTNGSVSVEVISSVGGAPVADLASICPGNSSTLSLFDYEGDSFLWQQSADGVNSWTSVTGGSGANTDVYTTAALNATLYFRAAVSNGACVVAYSDVLPVTVNASVGGTISSSSICAGNNTTLTLSGYVGDAFNWQQSDDGINFEQVSGGTGSTTTSFTTPVLYTTKYYEAIVTNGICGADAGTVATVTVSPASIAGSITAVSSSVCVGTNSNTLTLNNYVGNIQWQSSSSLTGTYTNIAGQTSATLITTNQSMATFYRAVVTSGNCASATSDPFAVEVSSLSVAGTISGAGIVCSGTNTSTLTLSGYTGDVQWQISTDYGSTYTDIPGENAATFTAVDLSQITYYITNVTSGSCSFATTNTAIIDVTNSNMPTSITGTTEICIGGSTTLTGSTACVNPNSTFVWYAHGYGGDAYDQGWDATTAISSTSNVTINNNIGGILNITSTNNDPQIYMRSLGSFDPSLYNYINIRYRVVSGTGGIAQIFFLTDTVTAPKDGFYKSGTLISDNEWHTVSISLSGISSNGNITGWRFDPTTGVGVNMDIDFIQFGSGSILGTGATLTVSPIASTTYYVNKKGSGISTDCISQLVTVNAVPTPTFTAQPGAAACANTDVSYFTESGKSNYVWTIPGTSGVDYTIISGGTAADNFLTVQWLTTGSKTVTINYTAGCAAASATSSTPTTVTVAPVGGTATAAASTVCVGSNTTISLTGYTGTIQWQNSTDGSSDWTNVNTGSGGTTATYTTPNLTDNAYYQAIVSSGVCAAVNSTTAPILVNAVPTTAAAGDDQTAAATCGLTSVALAGNVASIGTGAWSIISGTGGTITDASLATSTFTGTAGSTYTLRWMISNGSCSFFDDVLVKFNTNPSTANAGADQTGSTTCGLTTITLAGNSPAAGTGVWSIISGAGGAITSSSSTTSTFSGTAGSTYALRWTISSNPCGVSTDEVLITFNLNPTAANAGADQNASSTGGIISATLAGNSPSVGTGRWTIVSGTGGVITAPSNPTSTFTGSTGSSYTLRWTITNGLCTSTDEMVIASGFSWTGSGGDDVWGNGNNWSSGTAPNAGAEIVISSGNPKLDTDYSVGGSLTLSGTATLTVNPGKTLSIAAGGVANFGGKLVTFKSDATGTGQLGTIAGTLNNASNVIVERHIPAGKRAFRFFGSTITTTTTIGQNWMEGATPGVLSGYPYKTTSVYNPKPGYGTLITGAGGNANGFDESQTSNPSLFTFNNGTGAWVTVTNIKTGTIVAGAAYRMFVRGDRSYGITASSEPPPGSTILRTSGTIAQGQLTTGSQLPALSQAASGWSLIGNPYQSVVDMSSADVVKNNLTDYYYIWDPRMGTRGAYVAYNMTLLTNGSSNTSSAVNRYAQPGQAFFVQNTTAGSNSLVFKETAKGAVSNQTATFARNNTRAGTENGYTIDATTEKAEPLQTQANYASLSAILYYTDSLAAGAASTDATRVLFGSQFSNLVDARDGRKFTNLDETMSIKQGTSLLSMELRSLPDSSTKLPLSITQYTDKKYTMRLLWDEKLNTDTLVAYLRDKYTNKETPINKTGNTDVEYLIDADARSSAADRFEIFFKRTSNQVTAVINYDNGQYVKIYPNPVRTVLNIDFDLGQKRFVDIKVYDMAGRLVMDRPGMRKGSTLTMTGLAKGAYSVKVWGIDGKLLMSEKIIKD
jgi:autotransporter-associated beta strand protein